MKTRNRITPDPTFSLLHHINKDQNSSGGSHAGLLTDVWRRYLSKRHVLRVALDAGAFVDRGELVWQEKLPDGSIGAQKRRLMTGTPKSRWRYKGAKTTEVAHYVQSLPELINDIADAGGTVFLPEGEMDCWSLYPARPNVIGSYGGAVGTDFVNWLRDLDVVTSIEFIAHSDEAGRLAAQRLRAAIVDAQWAVNVTYRQLPLDIDVNDLLIALGGDHNALMRELLALPVFVPDLPKQKRRDIVFDRLRESDDEFITTVVREVLSRAENPKDGRNGWVNFNCILNPASTKSKRPAGINTITGVYKDFRIHGDGESFSPYEVADRLGIPRPTQQRETSRSKVDLNAAPSSPTRSEYHPVLHTEGSIYFAPPGQLADYVTHGRVRWAETPTIRYIADIPAAWRERVTAIRSPKGTGKTWAMRERVKEATDRGERVLLLTALKENVAHAAHACGVELYSDISDNLAAAPALAITLKSLTKLLAPDGAVPAFDLVVIDELNEVVSQLSSAKLFRAGEAPRCEAALAALLARAGAVIGLGADLRPWDIEWLADAAHDKVAVIDNLYRPALGATEQYTDRAVLMHEVIRSAQAPGLTTCAVGSLLTGDILKQVALDAGIPESAIAWVNRRDFNDEALSVARAALHDHDQLGQYRLFIYSYKLGSGFSYDRPSKAAFGIFDNPQLAPEQCSQMMHRFRQAGRYAWYMTGGAPPAPHETMPTLIQARHERNLARTGRKPTQRLLDFDTLISRDLAYQNASRNNPVARMHTLEHYQGHDRFILDWTKRSDQQNAAISALRQVVMDERKTRTLGAAPISTEEFQHLAKHDRLTSEVEYGRLRDAIERCIGRQIIEEYYDDLRTARQRRAVARFDRLTAPANIAERDDRKEDLAGQPLHTRSFHAPNRELITKIFSALSGEGEIGAQLDALASTWHGKTDLTAPIEALWQQRERDMRDVFDIRSDYSTKPMALLRLILKRLGLSLEYRRRRIDGVLTYEYRICPGQLEKMRSYVDSRRAFRAAGEVFQHTDSRDTYRDLEQLKQIPPNSGGDRENLTVEGHLIPS